MNNDEEIILDEPIPDYGDFMTMADFVACCLEGGFIDYDGFGNYSMEKRMNGNKEIKPSDVMSDTHDKRYTHVVWYNK